MADLILPTQLFPGDVLKDDIYPHLQGRKVRTVKKHGGGEVTVTFTDKTVFTFEDREGLIYVDPAR